MKQSKTRKRSISFSPVKIQEHARKRGHGTYRAFEIAYFEYSGTLSDVNNTTPYKAWHGIKLDKNRAIRLATFLGVNNYEELLPDKIPDLVFPESRVWDPNYSSPGFLLRPEFGIVPFHHREQELEELENWSLDDRRLAVRLYTAAGGMGKTRLAIEHCKTLAERHGWSTGFLKMAPHTEGSSSQNYPWISSTAQPLFIVLDYAETRRTELVALLLSALQSSSRIRIVLLARAAVDWWNILKTEGDGVGELLISPATSWLTLQPLVTDNKNRVASYNLAAESFARHLNSQQLTQIPDNIDDKQFERVLLLHMHAMIALDGSDNSSDSESILDVMLNRERKFWEQQANERGLPKGMIPGVGEMLARITVMGGTHSKSEAIDTLLSIPLLADCRPHEQDSLISLLHDLYPGDPLSVNNSNASTIRYIEPLQPDLLGEHLIANALKNDSDAIIDLIFS